MMMTMTIARKLRDEAKRRAWFGLTVALAGFRCTTQPGGASRAEGSRATNAVAERRLEATREAELARRLEAAVQALGPNYEPRTRHLDPDGKPKFTNRLIFESSPYLLQHAHNPVNWFAWGPEAFARARALSRPIFLSVGYSTCHWCHVMEEESFEDEEIARVLNARYVAIKVDREERPDVDALYMAAVQRLTGRGGWPMSVWLTPDRLPFFGGTYFPARDGDRGVRQGFLTVVDQMATRFDEDAASIGQSAQELTRRLGSGESRSPAPVSADGATLLAAREAARASHDATWGGRRGAPKFPSSFPVRLLLRLHQGGEDPEALAMARLALTQMAAGGMYDHVGGGFHRYSTDARWLVPHFEKMLYDNAQLAVAYLEAYQVTSEEDFARVARETLDYALREMRSDEGGFFSATDADSLTPGGHREEGYYFTWTPQELSATLPAAELSLVRRLYAVSDGGNFEGRNVLHTPKPRRQVAEALGLSTGDFDRSVTSARRKLLQARAKRPAPLRDDKLQVSWNALMISALARGARVLNEPRYRQAALQATELLMTTLRPDGRLRHSSMRGKVSDHAFLNDYAFLAAALLDVFELAGEPRYLDGALQLMNELERLFLDAERGGYFLTPSDGEQLLVRQKPRSDRAVPNGNSVAVMNQLRLHSLTTQDVWRQRAENTLAAFGGWLRRNPLGLDVMLLGLAYREGRPRQILIVADSASDADPLLAAVRSQFLPHRVLVVGSQTDLESRLADRVPWVAGKPARDGRATAYVCERGSCDLPTTRPSTLARQLARAARGG